MQLPSHYALTARWIFPIGLPPIERGAVVVEGDRLTYVGPADSAPGCPRYDLGNVAILPGLVNAHVHLEFSDLAAPLGQAGMPLVDWLPLGMSLRERTDRPPLVDRVATGLAESAVSGVTLVGEIATTPWNPPPLDARAGNLPRVTAFYELIAPTPARVPETLEAAGRHLAATFSPLPTWLPGLSPHAPYTACEPLLSAVAELAAHDVPLAIHLAESPEEIEWLATSGGPIADLLAAHGTPPELAAPAGRTPLEILDRLAAAPRVLVVHGNYLSPQEVTRIAAEPQRLAVVYCPRTHSFFGHGPHPLEALVAAGATVALGTDGRGSNPDLSLLAEMRHVRAKHPTLAPTTILELGTLAGARALGRDEETGSLIEGRRADLCLIPLPPEATPEQHANRSPEAVAAALLESELPLLATICGGESIHTGEDYCWPELEA